MNLTPIKQNMTEIDLGNGHKVLFSYKTPVAETYLAPEGRLFRMTNKKWSRTTTKHINAWLPKDQAKEMPQEYFDSLLAEVK
jgi:hypothetical protein